MSHAACITAIYLLATFGRRLAAWELVVRDAEVAGGKALLEMCWGGWKLENPYRPGTVLNF